MVYLFLKECSAHQWTTSPYPKIAKDLSGEVIEKFNLPGILLQFPDTKSAMRACLRIQATISRSKDDVSPMPMAISSRPDPKILPILVFEITAGVILVDRQDFKHLAAEHLENVPGPTVALEDGTSLATQMVLANSHNIGWALPTLELERQGRLIHSSEPKVINVHISDRSGWAWMRYVPWRLLTLLFVLSVFAGGALIASKNIMRLLKTPNDPSATNSEHMPYEESKVATADEVQNPPVEEVAPPLGFGQVVVETEPKNAMIYLNEKLVARRSPAAVSGQSNQIVHKLTVFKVGYEKHVELFDIRAGETKVIKVKLARTSTRPQGP